MATYSLARTITRYFYAAFCVVTFSALCMAPAPLGPQMPGGQMPGGQVPMNAKDDPFSPENIAQVAEEISKLTPEQQEQLYKESLDFLSKELNLSPEEVEKMITEEFTQAGGTPTEAPQPKGPSAETLKSEPVPTKKPVEEKIVPIKDLNDIATLLKNCADLTDTIMRKTSVLPDLPSRVDRWVEQKKLNSWPSGMTWASFKKQLELFVQKLGKLQNKDPKTNTYLYLPELLNNVSLKNNLDRIYRTLKRYNEAFTTSAIDIDTAFDDPLAAAGSLTTEAKDALLGILTTYGDAFYTQNILKDFDALIQKFEPSAQKLRTAEEERTKKALEESKKPRTTGAIKQAGYRGTGGFGGGSYYGEPSNGGYYPGSSYNAGYPGGYPSAPSYGSDGSQLGDKKDAGSSTAGSKAKGVPGEKATTDAGDKVTKDSHDEKSSSNRVTMANSLSERIAELIGDFGDEIESLSASVQKDGTLPSDSVKKLQSLPKKIERELATLTKTMKDFTSKSKEKYAAVIQEAYAACQPKINTITQMLAGITPKKTSQLPDATLALEAQENLKNIDSLDRALKSTEPLNEMSLNTLATITKKPLSDFVTKEEALALIKEEQARISDFVAQQETVIKDYTNQAKNYEEVVTRTDSIKSISETIKNLDNLMKTVSLTTASSKGA